MSVRAPFQTVCLVSGFVFCLGGFFKVLSLCYLREVSVAPLTSVPKTGLLGQDMVRGLRGMREGRK